MQQPLQPADATVMSNPVSPTYSRSSNPLLSRITEVLSTSYADTEFRQTLQLVDERRVHSDPKAKRGLKLALHREVLEQNGCILHEFRKVVEVSS